MLDPLLLRSAACEVEVSQELLGELLMMGIEEEQARRALIACKNSSLQAAMDQIFGSSSTSISSIASEEAIETGVAAGFDRGAVIEALKATNGDVESAMNRLLCGVGPKSDESKDDEASFKLAAFITHQGSSMHCGHYVAHLRFDKGEGEEQEEEEEEEEDCWVLYNDEKVAKARQGDASFPIELAYIYIYTRRD